jgi:hypothetical protein
LSPTGWSGWLALDDITVLDLSQPAPWHTGSSWQPALTSTLPAASAAAGSLPGQPHSGSGQAMPLHNLAQGVLEHGDISLLPDTDYTLSFWVKNGLTAGKVAVEIVPFANQAETISLWAVTSTSDSPVWQHVTTTFTMPAQQSGSFQHPACRHRSAHR